MNSFSLFQIHWFSIINSLIIVLFLSGLLAMIMVRALRRDIAAYNLDEEMVSWKVTTRDQFVEFLFKFSNPQEVF